MKSLCEEKISAYELGFNYESDFYYFKKEYISPFKYNTKEYEDFLNGIEGFYEFLGDFTDYLNIKD